MKRRPPPRDRRRPLMEELEPRLLLSAEVDPELVDPGRDGGDPPAQVALLAEQEAPVVSAVAALRKEIVFVDGGTEGYEDLVADLQSQPARGRVLEVVVLDPELDGVAQITEALDDREELDAVHIVSHGTQGAVQLGSTVLSGESLGRFESAIASWADAMDEHGDLLFYGCDLAGGDVGAAFVESIAKLTGADVAASLDLTGSDLLGGDWELEHHEGRIESTLAFSAELRATWVGVLDVASFQEGVAGYASTLDTELDSAAPDADNSNVARIDVDSGPTKQGLVQFENIFGSGPDQIPFGSTINSATVTFDVTDGTVPTATVAMHRLLVDWDESATWNSMGGGIQLDDSEATATADSVLADPVSTGAQTFTGLEATLQAWSDGAANHGWVLVSDDSDFWKFSSSDNGTVANNPLLTVDFTPPNAAPVLTPAAPSLPGISEDDAGNAGQDVATLLGASVSDADAGALEGIAVTATSVTGGGAWQFSIDGGSTWSGVGAVSDGSALVLRDTDRIRFQPDGQNGASASFDFRAWDRTDASTEGTRVDASTTGGSTAFSAASDTASITVGAVNDAPTVHAWYDTSWDYRKAVTIDASLADADLTDFPVLVSLSADADLAALAQADGDDILFTTADGTKLAHEIENFDAATGALTVWVKTDVSSLNDTTLFLYYGNAAASDQQDAANVWDSHFMGVWHLGDTPTGAPGDVRDSTIHANHGTTEGAMDAADSVVARVGRGLDFDETNDLIRVQDSATLDSVADEATFEVWVWFDDASDGNHQIIMTSSNRFSATDGYEWASQGSGDHFFYPDAMTPDGNFNLGPNPFTDQQWHHLAATLDFATKEVEIYVDGTPMTFTSEGVPGMWTTLTSSDDWLWGGNPDRASRYFDGMMDEIRVSDVVRSEEWIRASAANQSNPSAYLTLGAAESRGLALTPVQEDDTDPAGDDVSTILASGAGDRVTDVDTGALEGIAVVAVDDTNGTWEYTTDGGGSWLAFGSPSTNTARLLAQDANTAIRFVPDADWNGTVSDGITFHAWDQSSGANGGTADLGALGTGGTTAFSAATESASMTVVPYSALPVATDDSLTTAQDTPLVIDVATDLLANDSDPEGDALTLLDFTNPANGSVVDNGDGTLTYTPDPGYTGADSFDYVATDANQGTVHYWKLDGDGNDAVGTSHGTVTGTTAVAGHYGSALSFDEVDDRVVVPDFTYNNSFTISFRFKIDDNTGNDYQYLYSHGNVSSLEAVNIFLGEDGNTNAGMLRTKLADGNDTDDDATLSAALEVDISSLIGDGQWHTYTLTVASGTGSAVYIDGVLGNSSSYGGDAFDPGTNLHLGTREDLDPDRFYGGVLDSVQVFDRALDATQVSDLHSGGSARGTVDITVGAANTAPTATDDPGAHGALVSSLSPLSHWRLGESAGPAAADLGSAANDGTYQGVTLGQPGALNGDADTAARFDGAEYVEFAHSADYMIDEGALQFWFNADSTGSNQSLFSKDALGNTDGGHFSITYRADGSLEWRLQSASADYFATSAPVSAGAWHHVVASFGPSGMELYVDGVLAGSDAYTGGLGTSSGGSGNAEPFVIGASTQTSGSGVVTPVADFFTGWMDEVAIFGSQLTAEQAQDLHASGLQHYTIAEDSTLVVSAQEGVLANDFDGDGDALTAVLVAGPSSAASFSLNPDGSFDYTPTANFSGTDTFTYRADDGSDTSNIATVTITVTAVADAPVLTPTAPMLTPISEDDAGNGGDPVSSLVSGSDADGDTLGIAITATSVTGGGAWEFSTDGGSTWTAFGAVADGSALLLRDTDLVRFEPDGQNGATGSFDFRAWDQTSGTAGTKVDASTTGGTSAFSAASDTASIVVSDVNDAPVLAPLGPSLTPIGENDIGNAGDDVASILGLSVSDVDAVAVEGIAITATNVTGGGAWEFSTDGGGTWTAVGAVADGSALLLRATDLVRFQPDGQNGATGSFDFRAWDQTSGSAGAKVDTTTNGADTAFST
ncbi:MAG: DUF2341 domain-containing protein, partial [Myxococcota bacterium]|nr:DUF2341 domain-containing protein [Myxococcota bacterium]